MQRKHYYSPDSKQQGTANFSADIFLNFSSFHSSDSDSSADSDLKPVPWSTDSQVKLEVISLYYSYVILYFGKLYWYTMADLRWKSGVTDHVPYFLSGKLICQD